MIIDEIKLGMSFVELERFIDEIDNTWKLSVVEVELLESILDAIRTESYGEIKKIIGFWENSDYEELLDMIPNYTKECIMVLKLEVRTLFQIRLDKEKF